LVRAIVAEPHHVDAATAPVPPATLKKAKVNIRVGAIIFSSGFLNYFDFYLNPEPEQRNTRF
jgi:hypothetical protein